MNELRCKNKAAAISVLDTLALVVEKGTPRDSLLAVRKWIVEEVSDGTISEETMEMLARVFGGDEADKLGRAWLDSVENGDVPVEPVPPEPAHGARVYCLWNSETKTWEPELRKQL